MMIISFQTWEGLVPLQKWGMEEEKEGGSGEGEQCYGGLIGKDDHAHPDKSIFGF